MTTFMKELFHSNKHDYYNSSVLIQLSDDFSGSFWTGYKYRPGITQYYWHDGSPVTNAKWKTEQNNTGDCVIINANGEWEKCDCMEKNAFVCTLEVPYGNI